jgi:hypothetical protein
MKIFSFFIFSQGCFLLNIFLYLQTFLKHVGTLAQSVEQQTENLRVPGSIPGGTTKIGS